MPQVPEIDVRLNAEEDKLVRANGGLALKLANESRSRSINALAQDEVVQLAYIGLLKAAQGYRPYGEKNGYSEESIASGEYFSVFARKRILGTIADHFRSIDHVPKWVRRTYKQIMLSGYKEGRPVPEIADELEVSEEKIMEIIRYVEHPPVSVDSLAEAEYSSKQDVFASVLMNSAQAALVAGWDLLTERQQVIVALKYFEGEDFQTISEELGMSTYLVQQAHSEAVLLLHENIRQQISEQ